MTQKKREYCTDLLVILAYTILTLLMTYPLILNFFTHVTGCCDDSLNLWNSWWLKKSLVDLGTTPYYTSYLFHPTGVSLTFHTLSFFNSLLAIPLQEIMGIIGAYNFLFILSFVLSGYGTYLLVKYLTGDSGAAFVSGIIFAFCPYRFAHMMAGHMNLITTQWIPFYILYLIRTHKEENKQNPVLAGVFLFLVALSDWHYLGFMAIFTALFLAYTFWMNKDTLNSGFLKRFLLFVFCSFALIFPLMYPLLETLFSGLEYGFSPIDFAVTYSADLFGFFIPPSFHPLFKDYVAGIHSRFTGNMEERNVFFGYTVICLFFYYQIKESRIIPWISERLLLIEKKIRNPLNVLKVLLVSFLYSIFFCFVFDFNLYYFIIFNTYNFFWVLLFYLIKDHVIDFWSLVAVFFSIISLGPILHVMGTILFSGFFLPLPGLLFYIIPGLSFLRDPGRFSLITMLSLAVLAGYSMKKISEKRSIRGFFLVCVSSLILFEFLAIPLPLTEKRIPQIYENISYSEGDFALLEVPIPHFCSQNKGVMYYQTLHKKPIVGGYISITPKERIQFILDTPILQGFLNPVFLGLWGDTLEINENAYFFPSLRDWLRLRSILNNGSNVIGYCPVGKLYYNVNNVSEENKKLIEDMPLEQVYIRGDILKQDNNYIGQSVLHYYNVKYIIVNDNKLTETSLRGVDRLLSEVMHNKTPVYQEGGIRVYEVAEEHNMFMLLGKNWHPINTSDYFASRWISNNATIEVVNSAAGICDIEFAAKGIKEGMTLMVYLNNRLVSEHNISQEYTNFRVSGINLVDDKNTFVFYAPDGCIRKRGFGCISIAFRNISISCVGG